MFEKRHVVRLTFTGMHTQASTQGPFACIASAIMYLLVWPCAQHQRQMLLCCLFKCAGGCAHWWQLRCFGAARAAHAHKRQLTRTALSAVVSCICIDLPLAFGRRCTLLKQTQHTLHGW